MLNNNQRHRLDNAFQISQPLLQLSRLNSEASKIKRRSTHIITVGSAFKISSSV